MGILDPVFRLFEAWVDPFKPRKDYEPPNRLLHYVWFYVSQTRWAFLALLLYGFANALVEATVFSYVGQLVDLLTRFEVEKGIEGGWQALTEAHGTQLLGMLLVVAVLRLAVVTFGALIEEQVIVPGFFVLMRWQSHKHVIGQSLAFFQNDLAGRISQKVFQSGMAAGDMMISLLQVIWFVVVYALTVTGLLFAVDWQLGVVIVAWMIAFYVIARYFVPKVREFARITAETGSGVTGRMVDSYTNIQTVKLHASERDEEDWVLQASLTHRDAIIRFTRTLTSMRVSLSLVNGGVISLIAYIVVDLWLAGLTSLGSVAFVMALVLRLHLLSNRLLGNLNGFFRNMGVTQNTMDLVAHPHGIVDAPNASDLETCSGALEFSDVSFHYGNDEPVLQNIKLSIKPGEKIGIVGQSGSGKTTLVHLAMRFFDPVSGEVLVDGKNVATLTQASLRKQFSFVPQDVQLFHRSVAENIAYGVADASMEEIIHVARLANAHEFILQLKDNAGRTGYQARVGERGVKLSGGQRQRLVIARALLRNTPFVVLDEATSQLDSVIEEAIQENLLEKTSRRTVIVIAHRLSTVVELDRIVVMESGRIVAQGSHEALLVKSELYRRLWERQSAGRVLNS